MSAPLKIKLRITTLEQQRELMGNYLLMKVEQSDWHGVADAAMDLREIDAELRGLRFSLNTMWPVEDKQGG